jgi:hypothetical protein
LCQAAALSRKLEIFKFVREHGCPWDPELAIIKNLEITKWAFMNGFTCKTRDIFKNAAEQGKTDVLEWAKQTFPCKEKYLKMIVMLALPRSHVHVIEWAEKNNISDTIWPDFWLLAETGSLPPKLWAIKTKILPVELRGIFREVEELINEGVVEEEAGQAASELLREEMRARILLRG